jgi:hypothetical protein
MKKTLFSFVVLSFIVIAASAQTTDAPFTLSVGITPTLPLGDFGKGYSFGIGGQIQGEYMFSDNLTGVATTGYTSFFGKTQTVSVLTGVDNSGNPVYSSQSVKNPSVGHIPILVGARFYPSEQFFAGAQIGYGIMTGSGTTRSGFEYRPQVGYNAGPLQFILYYDGLSAGSKQENLAGQSVTLPSVTFSQLGLTALYKFGGGSN